jgi:hypothetical protein
MSLTQGEQRKEQGRSLAINRQLQRAFQNPILNATEESG